MNAFFHRSGAKDWGDASLLTKKKKEKEKAWTKGKKNTSTETSYIGQFNYEWHWQLNRESVWWFGGRGLLLEGEQPLWSLGARQVFLPAQCTFVARWLSSSDRLWQGVRAGSKWRAFSMISCQPSLITPSLYLSLVCPHNLFLSLLIQLSLYPPENFFFLLTHPISPFPSPFLLCSRLTWDEGWGFDEGLSKLTTQIMSTTCVLQCFPWSFLEVLRAPQLVTEEIYCFQFEEEMNAALVPF